MTNLGNKEVMAKNLAYHVERSGKTQKELAEMVGVAPSTFNDWVKGKKYPRIDKIEMLANFFGILKSDLIEEKNIHTAPVELAERHFEMVMDEDLNDIFEDFRKLDSKQRQIIKDMVHSLAATKKEA